MRIAVLGTGGVGRTLAGKLDELGHDVTVGTRDVAATSARGESDSYASWSSSHPGVRLASFDEAGATADLLVNATSGAASLEVLTAVGEENLADKVLLDVSNPLDFSHSFPPSLFVEGTDSLAEQIQSAFPRLRVVKALNTLTASLMVDPVALAGGDHSVFVSGDNEDAKAVVTQLLRDFGHTDVIDLGGITTARGTEMFLPLWLRLMGALGTPVFNVKIVR